MIFKNRTFSNIDEVISHLKEAGFKLAPKNSRTGLHGLVGSRTTPLVF